MVSEAAVKWSVVFKLVVHKLGTRLNLLFRCGLLRRGGRWGYVLLLLAGLFVVVVIIAVELQLLLDPGDESSDLMDGDLILLEDMGMFAIELAGSLLRVGIEDNLLQEDGVDLLLGVIRPQLVVDSNDGRLEPHAKPQVNYPVIAHPI